MAGLGPLVSPEKIRATLDSIYRYNFKRSLAQHDNLERTYALNDEAAVVVCDYGKAERPRIPFPYFAEAWTGLEYTAAALMIRWGMANQGVEIIASTRARFDGEKRNPWDEAECGHHYARAMSSWSTMLAMSGFHYDGASHAVVAAPPVSGDEFVCLWATGFGWGRYLIEKRSGATKLVLHVLGGELQCRSCGFVGKGVYVTALVGGRAVEGDVRQQADRSVVQLAENVLIGRGEELRLEVRG